MSAEIQNNFVHPNCYIQCTWEVQHQHVLKKVDKKNCSEDKENSVFIV